MTRNKSIDQRERETRELTVDAASPKQAGTNRESRSQLKSTHAMTRGGTRKRAAAQSATTQTLKPTLRLSRRRSDQTARQLKSNLVVSQAAAPLTTAQGAHAAQTGFGRHNADGVQAGHETLSGFDAVGITNTTAQILSDTHNSCGGRDASDIQRRRVTREQPAAAGTSSSTTAHGTPDLQKYGGSRDADDVQRRRETQRKDDIIGIIETIATNYREYRTFEKAETKLTLQIKGICRHYCDGDKTKGTALHDHLSKPKNSIFAESEIGVGGSRLIELRATLAAPKNDLQRAMEVLVEKLPIWTQWGQHQFGFSSWGLAKLIAEVQSHDPQYPYLAFGNYATASRIWKRFGLAVIDGQRQQRISHDADLAIRHGYNARRRSIAWVTIFGATSPGCVLNAQKRIKNRKGSTEQTKYRDIMEQRLADEAAWNAAGKYQTQASLILADAKKRKKKLIADNRKELEAGRLTPSHLSNRARCYAGKRFLADLWGAWHETMPSV